MLSLWRRRAFSFVRVFVVVLALLLASSSSSFRHPHLHLSHCSCSLCCLIAPYILFPKLLLVCWESGWDCTRRYVHCGYVLLASPTHPSSFPPSHPVALRTQFPPPHPSTDFTPIPFPPYSSPFFPHPLFSLHISLLLIIMHTSHRVRPLNPCC